MFFTGKSISSRRVDLRGKSKSEESREQTLERARIERVQRHEHRRRNQKAILIQACWRGRSISSKYLEELRASWIRQFFNGPADASWLTDPSSNYVRAFLFFAGSGERFNWEWNGPLLVAVCRAATHATTPTGELAFIAPAANPGLKSVTGFRAQRLAHLCLQSLFVNRSSFLGQSGGATSEAASMLVDFLVKFAAPDAWRGVLGQAEAARVVWRLLSYVAERGMWVQLAGILNDCGSPHPRPKKGAAEALVAQLVVRFLSVSASIPATPATSLHPLLCVPNLWLRCPALSPILGRVAANCIRSCGVLNPAELAAALPGNLMPGGKAAAAAAFLGNIITGSSKALQSDKIPEGSRTLHAHLATLLQTLTLLLPLHVFLPSRSASGTDILPRPSQPSLVIHPLSWDMEEMVPSELAGQVELLYENEGALVLQQLISVLLPHTSLQPRAASQELEAGVSSLCQLLRQLLQHSSQQTLLLRLAVSCGLVQRLWFSYMRPRLALGAGVYGQGSAPSSGEVWWLLPLSVLCPVFHAWLQTADILEDFHKQQQPLPHSELHNKSRNELGLIGLLKGALWQFLWMEFDKTLTPPNPSRVSCCRSAGQLIQLLFDLNSRRPFLPFHAFHAEQLAAERFTTEALNAARHSSTGTATDDSCGGPLKTQLGATSSRSWALLHYAPCLVPFLERARLFQEIVSEDREYHLEMERQSQQEALARGADIDNSQRFITIRRAQLLTDGFDHLDKLGDKLKGRIRIQFINEHGVPEAGVDGGGLFKDFMEDLIQQGFNPEYGIFKTTPLQQLYPNPPAYQVLHDAPRMLEFMGRMLGKAVYEGILSELPFAGFFLKRFRGLYCSLSDLPSLDPEVYRSLMVLRQYKGDISELCLTFSVSVDSFGRQSEDELKPGGKDIAVTNDNVIEYIHRMADFRLNKEMHVASSAFLKGFFDIIHPAWVQMFNEEEIQMLISGSDATAEQLLELQEAGSVGEVGLQLPIRGLDLEDMKAFTNYAGGYHEEHPVIISFWQALASMEPREQRAFLKFVTSSSRAPLLGFKYLEPPLCIQMAGHMLDPSATERLPTSATCMNLLKLPPYTTTAELKKKLLMSSQMGQGFHLS